MAKSLCRTHLSREVAGYQVVVVLHQLEGADGGLVVQCTDIAGGGTPQIVTAHQAFLRTTVKVITSLKKQEGKITHGSTSGTSQEFHNGVS